MTEFQKDEDSGQVSCRNRIVCRGDAFSRDWCIRFRDYCIYECVHKRQIKLEPVKQ